MGFRSQVTALVRKILPARIVEGTSMHRCLHCFQLTPTKAQTGRDPGQAGTSDAYHVLSHASGDSLCIRHSVVHEETRTEMDSLDLLAATATSTPEVPVHDAEHWQRSALAHAYTSH